jgi:hypothetical protein
MILGPFNGGAQEDKFIQKGQRLYLVTANSEALLLWKSYERILHYISEA